MKDYSEKITYQDGAFPEPHEKRLARRLVDTYSHEIIFLAPSRVKGAKTPDIKMDGLCWEIKSPRGKSSRTIENNFRAALKQSPYIIFDLQRLNLPTSKAVAQIRKQMSDNKGAKRVLIVTKNLPVVDVKR